MITYEYPLNERIRTLLRLEDLFARSRHFIQRPDPQDHHVALLTLFEIMEVAGRADLKSDLLQELERQKQVLRTFRNNPEISEDALNQVLGDMEQASTALFGMTGRIGQSRRRLPVRSAVVPLLAAQGFGRTRLAACRLDQPPLSAARRLGDHPAHPARVGQTRAVDCTAGHLPANARRQDRADVARAPR